ncbi:MAG: hypothetical protein HQK54_13435 [Oligoflexales bacterium]|nr:hypothetical protein [Oligoflexales bacterium]
MLRNTNIKVGGLTIFTGSHTFAKTGIHVARTAPKIIERFERILGYGIESFGMGGGFDHDFRNLDFGPYRAELARFPQHVKLSHESGRAIFGNAGYFLTRIRATKLINGKFFAVCDGGMAQNFLLSQTELKFSKKYAVPHVVQNSENRDRMPDGGIIVGSSCNRNDIIGTLPAGSPSVQAGDICIFGHSGAYNPSYTVSGFLSSVAAREYIID